MKKHAIIAAGGFGRRMKSELPKQFLLLYEVPLLMHTIKKFYDYDTSLDIILILQKEHLGTWRKLIEGYSFTIPHQIALGGATRFDSVQNGLNTINEDGLVAVHDGARPLIKTSIIAESFLIAKKYGNAITTVTIKDSLRQMVGKESISVNREEFRSVQTPQTFSVNLIKKAYVQAMSSQFSDDAGVLENYGEKIRMISGCFENVKITTPEDLLFAETILAQKQNA